MDLVAVSEAVAGLLVSGAISGMGEDASRSVISAITERVRAAFGSDRRSLDALEAASKELGGPSRAAELAAALRWYAEQDNQFAAQLAQWASEYASNRGVIQNIYAGQDAYVAGRDQTVVHYRPQGD